jgi:hypothetical protein
LLDVLESLPSAFTKDFAYGLGLAKPYRFIIDAVEQLSSCTEMVITGKHRTGPAHDDEDIFYISRADFEQLRTELNKIDRHAQTAVRAVKLTAAHNIFAERLGIPKLDPKTGLHPYRKLFTAVAEGKEELSEEDQNTELLY